MGAHRKPRTGLLEGPAARRGAVSVGAAALFSATLLTQGASAQDSVEEQRERAETARDRAQDVRAEVDRLFREAGTATQLYNEAAEEAGDQQDRVDELLDEAAEATERVNEARRTLGTFAAAQYRHGGGSMPETATLLLASNPQAFFDRTHALDRLGDVQQQALADFSARQQEAEEHGQEATEALTELEDREADLQEQQEAVQGRLADAQALLDQLTDEEEAAYEELERLEQEREERERAQRAQEQSQGGSASASVTSAADGSYTSLAAQAIAFAEAQLGKPYVWGATGPDSYDCSGLTQAAWRAAGVEIPRVTWDQVNHGTSVSRDQLQPGDLIFFYDDISHVGLYVGDGQMIHAPKPGDVVEYASIDVMPIYGYVRPA